MASRFLSEPDEAPNTTRSAVRGGVVIGDGFNLQERGSGVHLHVGYGHHLADFSGKWGDHLHLHFHGLEHGQAIPHRNRIARLYGN